MRTLALFVILFVVLGSATLVGQVIPTVPPPGTRQQPTQETRIYLITFRPGTPASERANAVQASGARLRMTYNAANAASVEIPDAAALARLRNHPRVLSVFVNRTMTLRAVQGRGGNGERKPRPPLNLQATATSSSQVNLTWADDSDNENGFSIERCFGAACTNFVNIAGVGPNVTTFSDLGLAAQSTYRYRVQAFNAAGNSKYSNIAQATTQAAPPPSAPSNLTSSVVSHTQINLNWVDNSNNEDGFQLERCTGPAATCVNFTAIPPLAANTTSFNNTGLQPQTTYTYRVRSFNTAGPSAYSNSVEAATPAAPPTPPSAPSNLTSSVVSHTQINLNWVDNSNNEDGFQLERCTGPAATCVNFTAIPPLAANTTSFNNTGLQPQTTYTYRVRSFNTAGPSAYSNSVEAATPAAPPTPPSAPSNLTSSVVSHTQINLNWVDNSNNEDGFQLERCTGPAATCVNFTAIPPLAANTTSFNNTGLQPQTTYTYRVRSFNTAGPSAYSNSVEAATPAAPPTPPSAPSNLTSSVVSHTQINLNWVDNSNNEDGFQLERCTGPVATCVNFTEVAPVAANTTSFNNTGLQPQTTYTYRVRSFNTAGPSAYSNSVEATTPAAPPTPPSAPINLTSSVVSHTQINLNWVDNSNNEDGFQLERCTGTLASCVNFVSIAQLSSNVTTFNNVGVQAQTTYTYRVRAFNLAGWSSYSNSILGTTPAAPPSTQVVPSGVQRIGAAPGTLTWTGAGVGVAVVDTGLDFNHLDLDLAPEIQGENSFNAFGGSCFDFHGHGSHVGGIIGAKNNTIDVVGVAPNVTLYCVNVFEPDPVQGAIASDESLMAGLNWILTHANLVSPRIRVVNMSLGRDKTPEDNDPNHPLHVLIKALYDSGISIVVAAGNDALRVVAQQVPAGYPEVMAVASTTAQDGVNGYDEFFPACVGISNIKKDTASYFTTDGAFLGGIGVTVSAPGEGQADLFDFSGLCFLESIGILSVALGGGTTELSGTSMAAPHVAGVVALMWEKELGLGLNLAPEVARTRIRNNVDRLGTAPLDSPTEEYTFDSEREGVIWAPAAVGDFPPPPQNMPPAVSIVSPATGSSFSAGASINFQGTAIDPEQGNIAASLVWTSSRDGQIGTGASFTRTLTGGGHVITASLVDNAGNPGSASSSITVGSSSIPTTVQAQSITYALVGTRLFYTVKVVDEFGAPVPGATVEVDLYEYLFSGTLWISTTTSNSQGNAQFLLDPADLGCYVTAVRSIVATGLTFVPGTPSNNFCNF